MTDFETDAETRAWETVAAANGVVLRGVDLNDVDDMKELYRVLDVKGMASQDKTENKLWHSIKSRRFGFHLDSRQGGISMDT